MAGRERNTAELGWAVGLREAVGMREAVGVKKKDRYLSKIVGGRSFRKQERIGVGKKTKSSIVIYSSIVNPRKGFNVIL